jgi:hypothetical protein
VLALYLYIIQCDIAFFWDFFNVRFSSSERNYLPYTYDWNAKAGANESILYDKIQALLTSSSKDIFSFSGGSKRLNIVPVVDLGLIRNSSLNVRFGHYFCFEFFLFFLMIDLTVFEFAFFVCRMLLVLPWSSLNLILFLLEIIPVQKTLASC